MTLFERLSRLCSIEEKLLVERIQFLPPKHLIFSHQRQKKIEFDSSSIFFRVLNDKKSDKPLIILIDERSKLRYIQSTILEKFEIAVFTIKITDIDGFKFSC